MYIRVAVFYFGAIRTVPSCRLGADSVVQSGWLLMEAPASLLMLSVLLLIPVNFVIYLLFRRLAGPLFSSGVCVSFYFDIPKQDAYRGSCDRDGL